MSATEREQLSPRLHPAVHRPLAELGAAPVAFDDERAFRNFNTAADLADLYWAEDVSRPPSR